MNIPAHILLRALMGQRITGIMNLKALQDVIDSQSLSYLFPFSQFSFPTDLGFVILAEGRKSAFFQVRLAVMSFIKY